MKGYLLIATVIAILHISPSHCTADVQRLPTVDLGYAIHQAILNSSGQYPYLNFSNIRFGQEPVGSRRFSPPLAPQGRNTTVNDGQKGTICPQSNPVWFETAFPFLSAYLGGQDISNFTHPSTPQNSTGNFNISSIPQPDPRTTEDCLFLDVIVPQTIFNSIKGRNSGQEAHHAPCSPGAPCKEGPVRGGAPVLVWLYGGGYTSGDKTASGNPAGLISKSLENANEGVIFVAMNYRLGLFGWLSGSDDVTANAGLFDQRLALEWVQQYIHLFGGDPSRVTVSGESAGAGSIMHHITAYGGKGSVPFHQAVTQSPAFQPTIPSQSRMFFSQVVKTASLVTNTTITSAAQLRLLPFEALYAVNAIVTGLSPYGQFTFGPVVDPTPGSMVPALPGQLLAKGHYYRSVSILVGHNSDEGLLFTDPSVQSQSEYMAQVAQILPTSNSSLQSEITNVLYPPNFNGSYGYTNQIERTALSIADFTITCNAHFLASSLPGAYAYLFSAPPGLHGEDIAYTFFNGDTSSSDEGAPVISTVAVAFQRYLISFAMTGKPTALGFEVFIPYGNNATASNIGVGQLGAHIRDPAAREQCKFWQAAPYS